MVGIRQEGKRAGVMIGGERHGSMVGQEAGVNGRAGGGNEWWDRKRREWYAGIGNEW
jgi:hypothetical protein